MYTDGELHVIENTKKAQEEFGTGWGACWLQITQEQIQEIKNGKQLAFFDGEYVHFISLKEPI